ncbi:MAG: hypothetical protein AAGU12_13495 [Clostridiales bacterium]
MAMASSGRKPVRREGAKRQPLSKGRPESNRFQESARLASKTSDRRQQDKPSKEDIRRERKKHQRRFRFVILFVSLIFLAGGLYSVLSFLLTSLADLDMVKTMAWEYSASGQAWSFQRELITSTDQRGTLIPIVNEGERVSKGLEVARLNYLGGTSLNEESNRRLYSPVAGIVSYEPDGLEIISMKKDYEELTVALLEEKINQLMPATKENQGLAGLLQDKMAQEGGEGGEAATSPEEPLNTDSLPGQEAPAAVVKTPPKEVAAGTVIMKITDNLSDCYVYIRLPEQEEAPLAEADPVIMRLEGAGEGKGTVFECQEIPGGWGVLVRLESGLEALRHSRQHQLTLVLGSEDKAVVSQGTVITKNGQQGIYVVKKNKVHWQPVQVLEERDGLQVVEGIEDQEIVAGDIVVTRPWIVWEGMRLRG